MSYLIYAYGYIRYIIKKINIPQIHKRTVKTSTVWTRIGPTIGPMDFSWELHEVLCKMHNLNFPNDPIRS